MDVADIVDLYFTALRVDVSREFGRVTAVQLMTCARCDLRFFAPAIAGSPEFYEELQPFPWYYQSHKPEYEVARPWIQPRDAVLEVGCGRAAFADLIQARSYTGLELSDVAVQMGAAAGRDVRRELVQDHAEDHEGAYDVVVSFQVLEHVPDVSDFLVACLKCLRPGGLLIASVPSADGFMGRIADNYLNMPPHHVTWWTDRALRGVADQFGLQILDLVPDQLGDDHKVEVLSHALLRAFRSPPRARLVEKRGMVLRLRRLTRLIGRRAARHWTHARLLPRGHSITAIYKVPVTKPSVE